MQSDVMQSLEQFTVTFQVYMIIGQVTKPDCQGLKTTAKYSGIFGLPTITSLLHPQVSLINGLHQL